MRWSGTSVPSSAKRQGTTRDTIEEFINVRGLPLRVIDTAGLRDTVDPLENAGIASARARPLPTADLTSCTSSMAANRRAGSAGARSAVASADRRLQQKRPRHPSRPGPAVEPDAVHVSCRTEEGLDALVEDDLPARDRRAGGLERCRRRHQRPPSGVSPACPDAALEDGRAALGEGRFGGVRRAGPARGSGRGRRDRRSVVDTEEILGRIFSTFASANDVR